MKNMKKRKFIKKTMPDVTNKTIAYTRNKIEEPKSLYSHDQLIQALYYIWQIMDQAMMDFFLVGKTAKQAINRQLLVGEKVELGMRHSIWESGNRRLLDSLILPEESNKTILNKLIYTFNGIPIEIALYKDDEWITSPDTIFYEREAFKVPNTLQRFEQIYG